MRVTLQESLYERYRLIFRQGNVLGPKGPVGWGIQCGDGWYPLLDGLCDVLTRRVRDGSGPIIDVVQVKQKIGSLRFYLKGGDDYSQGAIRLASAMSYLVCEETGRPGTLMATNRGVRTLAEDFGRRHGYHPLRSDTRGPSEFDVGAEMASVPNGWRAIATALKGLVADHAPSAVVRLDTDNAGLSVEIRNGTDWTEGAGECARALAARTNPVTGAMLIPG